MTVIVYIKVATACFQRLGWYSYNTELNDLRKIISLRKSEVTVERISVCHGKFGGAWHTLSAMFLSHDVINILPLRV